MLYRLVLIVVVLLGSAQPALADSVQLKICANGDTPVYVATVLYVESLFGNSYQASGWHRIAQDRCKIVYDSEKANRNVVYLSYAYNDSNDVTRNMVSPPGHAGANPFGDGTLIGVKEHFCVQPGQGFQYKAETKEEAQNCKSGFVLAEFSDSFSPGHYTSGTQTLGVLAESGFDLHPALTVARRTGRLIMGDEVHLDKGGQWVYANGGLVPGDLIAKATGMPPLSPRLQFSTSDSPVQGYIQEIKAVVASVEPCTEALLFKTVHSGLSFNIDDYGVIKTKGDATAAGTGFTAYYGAAIANLDLANPRVESRDQCYLFNVICKGNVQCSRRNDSATVFWTFWVNTKAQGDQILDALRKIAPYYPDGKGEMR